MKICINGGHCPGKDPGAVGEYLQEADVAKQLMHSVAGYLRNVGYEVLEVQENELHEITDASNAWGADIFVSIHCNAATNRSAKGTETYCYGGGKGELLAYCIQRQIVKSLRTVDRGVKFSKELYVLRHTDCPAVLAETAFISNPEDEALLRDNLDDFARAIARSITDYYSR